jgi:hypothetical protein
LHHIVFVCFDAYFSSAQTFFTSAKCFDQLLKRFNLLKYQKKLYNVGQETLTCQNAIFDLFSLLHFSRRKQRLSNELHLVTMKEESRKGKKEFTAKWVMRRKEKKRKTVANLNLNVILLASRIDDFSF